MGVLLNSIEAWLPFVRSVPFLPFDNGNNDDNLREFACLTAVILAPLRVEGGVHGRSATSPRRRKPRTQFLYYGGILPPKSHRSIGIDSAWLNSYTTVGLGRQNSAQIPP